MKLFIQNYNNVLNDVQQYYEKTTNLLEAKACVLWNDLVHPQKKIIELAKEHNVPSLVIEHGMKAVTDYQSDLRDISNGMGGKPMIADKILVWGNKSREILLSSNVPKNKIEVIGSPIIWEHNYVYESSGEQRVVKFMGGKHVTDPSTGRNWDLKGCKSFIPQREEGGKIVAYFIHHDYTDYARLQNGRVWDQIKNRDDVFVKLSQPYASKEKDNPFSDLVSIKDERTRREKSIIIPTNLPSNLVFIKSLLRRCAAVVTTNPGTINGICWAMDVPVIVPKIDWHLRDLEGKEIFDVWPGDYTCEVKDLNKTIDEVIKKDTKKEDRKQCAIDFMGVNEGSPTKNIRGILDEFK